MATLSCPIGILQYHMATHTFPFLLLGYIALIGVLFGRAACGWICPFGWIQDMIMKIKARKFRIPKVLNKLKWVILPSLAVVLPYYTGVHWFSKLCPYGALIGGIPWALWNPIDPVLEAPVIEPGSFGAWFVIKMIILAFFLGWFALSKRPFCRTTCPMGLIFSWFNRISLLKIEIKVRCPDCALCNALCPMDLKVNEEIESENCIKCLDCTACRNVQTKFSLRYGFTRKKPSPEEIPVIPS
jgi:polyferredoxin